MWTLDTTVYATGFSVDLKTFNFKFDIASYAEALCAPHVAGKSVRVWGLKVDSILKNKNSK